MTIAQRFGRFIPAKLRHEVLKAQIKALEAEMADDEEYIKDWFRERPHRRRNLGVQYSVVTYQRIDAKKARRLLGRKAAEAEVTTKRETLTLDEQAQSVRDAGAKLRPVRRTERASA